MKANELTMKDLMLGDWVYNKHHGKNIRLTPYDFFTHTHNEFGEQELAPSAKPTFGRDLEPIPLTPEILEKNGFKKCAGNEWSVFKYEDDDYTKKALYQVLWSAKELYLEIASYTSRTGEFNRMGVEFVHELQHALRLCGIEKEIIL